MEHFEKTPYPISTDEAQEITRQYYGKSGTVTRLHGELDLNFKIAANDQSYILKISRPGVDALFIDLQEKILEHLTNIDIVSPRLIKNSEGKLHALYTDTSGKQRIVRLLSWIEGRVWSSVNPVTDALLFSLGEQSGNLCQAMHKFDHPAAQREFEWDINLAAWVFEYSNLFDNEENQLLDHFKNLFIQQKQTLLTCRKSVVHNDVNDNNILVSNDLLNPEVLAIIDFGDAVYTSTINDLAITLAYAVMGQPDPLRAAIPIIRGYHKQFKLRDEELELLYMLVGMRLVMSVTRAAINLKEKPGNSYLQISAGSAWELLKKWSNIDPSLAYYTFRHSCGLEAHPGIKEFHRWIGENASASWLFPALDVKKCHPVDMSVSSTWLGSKKDYSDFDLVNYKLARLQKQHPHAIVAGGYLESRPFYSTRQFRKEGNQGPEYRSVHLGIDFWVEAQTALHAPLDGKVYALHNNDLPKDYGPTIILEHSFGKNKKFYTLYGHLSLDTLKNIRPGQHVRQGEKIGSIGMPHENGGWSPHLHFQLMLDMLGNHHDFPGVAFPDELGIWKDICPDPMLLFNQCAGAVQTKSTSDADLISYRKTHLGQSLSLTYDKPLHIVRGEGTFLIDIHGRKYLDTVNNVAHVGHEHPRVVAAGQKQMAVLNTNTRYLHSGIHAYAEEILQTFPDQLSVIHFVNSGSEANELALRMARTITERKDIVAVEAGYHGNTGACIDISAYKFDGKGGAGAPEHTHIVPLPDAFRGTYRGEGTGRTYAAHVQQQIEKMHNMGRKPAAFICESILSCGGQIELPDGYLKEVYAHMRQNGGLCIADEVQVGAGRTGKAFWGFELHDVVPDIVTIGKPIGNGHPLAAVVCTADVADAFANGMEYFNTFGGNPVSCAIGLEVLKVIQDEGLQENALNVGDFLIKELKHLQKRFPIIGHVRGQGLFIGFELADKHLNPLGHHASYLANRMRELGILMSTDGPDHNVMKIKPPMVFTKDDAEELLFRLNQVLNEDFMWSGYA